MGENAPSELTLVSNIVPPQMGLLTLELLRDCKENVNLLATEAEERR